MAYYCEKRLPPRPCDRSGGVDHLREQAAMADPTIPARDTNPPAVVRLPEGRPVPPCTEPCDICRAKGRQS